MGQARCSICYLILCVVKPYYAAPFSHKENLYKPRHDAAKEDKGVTGGL